MAREFNRLDEPQVPSSTFTYFFREAFRRIWSAKRSSFVAISMIAISLLILGIFLLVAENIERSVEQWQGKTRVNVYFEPEATPQQIAAVEGHLASRRELSRHRFITREEALQRFHSFFGTVSDLVNQLDENPFPPSFEIEVTPQFIQSRAFNEEMAAVKALPGIAHVQFDWDWLARLRRLVRIINLAGVVAGGILAIAAAFTIANVIRLTMMLYREEIAIMRLVGATERIIRGPFLVEGIVQGTLGGLLAAGLLFLLFLSARQALDPSRSLLFGFLVGTFLPWQKIAILVGGGMLAGWLGSWLSVRERTGEA
ncbi:MAG TPA: permease-like cell division protein FtsX [Thermoanaerobaculia bacterium]|nr:permease-like cell division protein FtsX [Thermoanaerobaculia bacterium]